ncbi:molybdopterin converting factor, subunit 2-like protein [Enterobacter hormaechei subsp. xiangfangensis]|nr:molybdopterin converting factor, subunit 2-like protein [Enterobacter hormaechei subsp. xiangfangensis]
MTEKSLAAIVEEARGRWPLGRVTVIHRIGEMWPGGRGIRAISARSVDVLVLTCVFT